MADDLADMTTYVCYVFLKSCFGLADFRIVLVYFLIDDEAFCFCCFPLVWLLLRSTHYINKVINLCI